MVGYLLEQWFPRASGAAQCQQICSSSRKSTYAKSRRCEEETASFLTGQPSLPKDKSTNSLPELQVSSSTHNGKGGLSMATQQMHTYCAMCVSRCGVLATVEDGRSDQGDRRP